MFYSIDNPFGADAFAPVATPTIKPHKLPRAKRQARVLRAPKPLSAIIKNTLLTYNG